MNNAWQTTETAHYFFHYQADTLAEKDLMQIIAEQEGCFKEITEILQLFPNKKITYWLCNTRTNLMQASQIDFETNGITFIDPDRPEIYAVYNEDVQCTGFHEDVHAITCQFAIPASSAIIEGLAMFFDKVWWKIPNEVCTRVYMEDGKCNGIAAWIADNNAFFQVPDTITYPVMGAFTSFLIDKFGIERYKEMYLNCTDVPARFTQVFNMSLTELERVFAAYMMRASFSPKTLSDARTKLYA